MTQINWNEYFDLDEELEETATKNEGEFAIVSVKPKQKDGFYKIHIGLYDGKIIISDDLSLRSHSLTKSDLIELSQEVDSVHYKE